jgi:hypothetical protein
MAVFDSMGIRFEYPEAWSIDEPTFRHGHASVSVVSPGGAFWSLSVHAPTADLAELLGAVLECLREDYPELESETIRVQVDGREITGYDIHFFYLDLTNTALIRGFQTPHGSYLLLCQAEDREFEEVKGVFYDITRSLLGQVG